MLCYSLEHDFFSLPSFSFWGTYFIMSDQKIAAAYKANASLYLCIELAMKHHFI